MSQFDIDLFRRRNGLAHLVAQWAGQPRVAALRDESKLRLGRLVKRAADCVADGRCNEGAALRFIDWVEPLLRRESYLALLVERPAVQERLRVWRNPLLSALSLDF